MTVTVIDKTPLTVPDQVRRKAGFKPGDKVEFKVSGGMVTILPKATPYPRLRRYLDTRRGEESAPCPETGPRGENSTLVSGQT